MSSFSNSSLPYNETDTGEPVYDDQDAIEAAIESAMEEDEDYHRQEELIHLQEELIHLQEDEECADDPNVLQPSPNLPTGAMPTDKFGKLSPYASEFWFPESRNCPCCKGYKHGCNCRVGPVMTCQHHECTTAAAAPVDEVAKVVDEKPPHKSVVVLKNNGAAPAAAGGKNWDSTKCERNGGSCTECLEPPSDMQASASAHVSTGSAPVPVAVTIPVPLPVAVPVPAIVPGTEYNVTTENIGDITRGTRLHQGRNRSVRTLIRYNRNTGFIFLQDDQGREIKTPLSTANLFWTSY